MGFKISYKPHNHTEIPSNPYNLYNFLGYYIYFAANNFPKEALKFRIENSYKTQTNIMIMGWPNL